MMFNRNSVEKTGLEKAIEHALLEMTNHDEHSDEYKKIVDQLTKLYHLQKMEAEFRVKEAEIHKEQTVAEAEIRFKESELLIKENDSAIETKLKEAECRLKDIEASERLKEFDRRWKVSPDTAALVLGNLIGILVIVGHERAHVVTSKALNFVMKAR
jgi:hypothetical protein